MLRLLFVLGLALLSACDSDPVSVHGFSEDLSLKRIPCRYNVRKGVTFSCYVAERQDGITHSYLITIISPKAEARIENEAVLSIPGGPGQGAQTHDAWVDNWADFMVENELSVDLVLFDPPGTLGSDAYWRCDAFEDIALSLASENVTFAQESSKLAPILDQCLERYDEKLKKQGFSPNGLAALSTSAYVERLSVLMKSLPYKSYHLLGTSYGTRVALMLAENEQVASLTLDSAYPFSRGSLLDTPSILNHAQNLHRRFYREYYDDAKTYDQVLQDALMEVSRRPQLWKLERWDGESDVGFMLNSSRLNDLAFSVLYDESMLEYFYEGLRDIEKRPDTLRWVLEDFVTQVYDPSFSTLTFVATECSDNRRVSYEEYQQEVDRFPELKEDWQQIYQSDVCDHALFSKTTAVQEESYVNKPTLVFSGELDPVTPVFWNRELKQHIESLQLVSVDGVGHAVLGSGRCEIKDLMNFWETRDIKTEITCSNE